MPLSVCRTAANIFKFVFIILSVGYIVARDAEKSENYRLKRAVSLTLENTIGFSPRDVLLESLESKTCFDMKNRGQSVGTEVILSTCGFPTPSWNQLFTLQDIDGQHFVISNKGANCLSFSPGSNTKLVSANQCTSDAAKFYLDNSFDGQSYLIRQKSSNKCIIPAGSGGTSGSDESLKPTTCDRNDPRQFWRIFSKGKPRRFAPHPSRCTN